MERRPAASRAALGRVPGLDWPETYVLKAACDIAIELWDRRLTFDQVAARLARVTRIPRRQIEVALDALTRAAFIFVDDAPGNPEIVLTLTTAGLEAYCRHLLPQYDRITVAVLKLVCQDAGADVVELAHRSGHQELLVDHILDVAEGNGLLRLARTGQYIVVKEVKPQLRRWVTGAA